MTQTAPGERRKCFGEKIPTDVGYAIPELKHLVHIRSDLPKRCSVRGLEPANQKDLKIDGLTTGICLGWRT
jgi:hypothetical protein